MQLFKVQTRVIEPGDNVVDVILEALQIQRLMIEDGDIFIIASKVVAMAQGQLVKLASIKPSEKAKKLAEEYQMDPRYVEIVLREAQMIYGGVSKALLTLKNNILIANAGVDHKNAPKGSVVLWPENPHKVAGDMRYEVFKRTEKKVGVLIADSRVTPLRMGTTGVAIGVAGFEPVKDYRGVRGLYGNPLLITRHALEDDLASAAHLIMGEAAEQIPVVLAKNTPLNLSEEIDLDSMIVSSKDCLFMSIIEQLQDK